MYVYIYVFTYVFKYVYIYIVIHIYIQMYMSVHMDLLRQTPALRTRRVPSPGACSPSSARWGFGWGEKERRARERETRNRLRALGTPRRPPHTGLYCWGEFKSPPDPPSTPPSQVSYERGFEFRVSSFRCRVSGVGLRVLGFGFRVSAAFGVARSTSDGTGVGIAGLSLTHTHTPSLATRERECARAQERERGRERERERQRGPGRRVQRHCRANSAQIRQSRPDSGLGFQGKALETFLVVPSSLGSA